MIKFCEKPLGKWLGGRLRRVWEYDINLPHKDISFEAVSWMHERVQWFSLVLGFSSQS
jgi:hypothetical protein